MTKFYITTTLPYVNADPHIGFALEIIQADVLARYHRILGDDVVFNTGTDEHGLKIYRKAIEEKENPQVYTDKHAAKFEKLKKALNVTYTNFIRTTNPNHIKAAQNFWVRCEKNGDIYKEKYKIKYCVGCELEKTESELIDGKCPIHPNLKIEIIEEENYFFRFSKYQKPLLQLYEKNPTFVVPDFRFNEIKEFVKSGLTDFSISRLKEKMPWGVSVPGNENHVMYVWFDALVNYISTLGWPGGEEFKNFWPGVQLAGKDNLRQQSAMWQAMLMSAGVENSKQIMIHGFITSAGQKISKSLGNTIDPFELVKDYGTDALRYWLLGKMSPFEDADFTLEKFKKDYNADLANGLGNLVARVAKLCEKNETEPSIVTPKVPELLTDVGGYHVLLESFQFNIVLEQIWREIKFLDVEINNRKPWSLSKEKANQFLTKITHDIRNIAFALLPFLPQTAEKIEEQFKGPKIISQKPLFPRI